MKDISRHLKCVQKKVLQSARQGSDKSIRKTPVKNGQNEARKSSEAD